MTYSILIKRLSAHTSSFTLLLIVLIMYLSGDASWLDSWLPENGKPLAIGSLAAIIVVYELTVYGNRQMRRCLTNLHEQQKEILHQMEVNRLIQAVNGMYGRFIASGDAAITNEYSIKELNELIDMRARLNVNSYTQGRLEFLATKIVRG